MRRTNMTRVLTTVLLSLLLSPSLLKGNGNCTVTNFVFKDGEKVTYNAVYNWGFIWLNAGLVTFSVDSVKKDSKPAYHFKAVGVTHKGYDKLFMVRDTFQSFVDPISMKPFEFIRSTQEGSYKAYEYYSFDKDKRKINTKISKEGGAPIYKTIDWPECGLDIVSLVYYARNLDFSKYKPGDKIPIVMIVDGEVFDLYIRYLGREEIKTRDGRRFRCLKFTPLLVEGTIFNAGEDMTVWMTDDNARIPILVEAKILVGSVKAVFVDAQGLRNPITAEILGK